MVEVEPLTSAVFSADTTAGFSKLLKGFHE